MLQRLLLLPLLSPLLAVLLLAAVNPRPWVSVRLLTWSSPAWPLGGWIAAAASLGAAVSAAGAALALQTGEPGPIPERQARRRTPWSDADRDSGSRGSSEPNSDRGTSAEREPWNGWAGPSRNPQEPAPTVSVPFRVIRKGTSARRQTDPAATPTAATPSNDDWNTPLSEDW